MTARVTREVIRLAKSLGVESITLDHRKGSHALLRGTHNGKSVVVLFSRTTALSTPRHRADLLLRLKRQCRETI